MVVARAASSSPARALSSLPPLIMETVARLETQVRAPMVSASMPPWPTPYIRAFSFSSWLSSRYFMAISRPNSSKTAAAAPPYRADNHRLSVRASPKAESMAMWSSCSRNRAKRMKITTPRNMSESFAPVLRFSRTHSATGAATQRIRLTTMPVMLAEDTVFISFSPFRYKPVFATRVS